MISKKSFVKAIDAIRKTDIKLDTDIKNRDLRMSFCEYSLQDEMISLLESAMAIPVDKVYGSIISWWIYETRFGKKKLAIKEDNKKIYLKTPEALYDYCKDMSIED